MAQRSLVMRVIVPLLIIDGALILGHLFFRDTLGFFDLDKEGSVKAVFSGMQLIALAACAGALALLSLALRAPRRHTALWAGLAALFFLLAFDDMMMIHERIGFVLNRWTGWRGAYESFNWLTYFSPAILLGGAMFAWAVRELFRHGRREGIAAACGVFGLFLTLGIEYLGGQLLKQGMIPTYHASIIIEESLLLLGESLLLGAMLSVTAISFDRAYVPRNEKDSQMG